MHSGALVECNGLIMHQCLLHVQDDVLEKSRHTIEYEYKKLCRTARERAASHPGEVASVTTEDAWTWVEEQAGNTFTGQDINMVLQVLVLPPVHVLLLH